MHADEEAALLDDGSRQEDLWGINLYPAEAGPEWLEFDSMINVRPSRGNRSRDVEDPRQQARRALSHRRSGRTLLREVDVQGSRQRPVPAPESPRASRVTRRPSSRSTPVRVWRSASGGPRCSWNRDTSRRTRTTRTPTGFRSSSEVGQCRGPVVAGVDPLRGDVPDGLEQIDRGLIVRKMAARLRDLPELHGQALDGIRRVRQPPAACFRSPCGT